MNAVAPGIALPDITLPATGNQSIRLADLKGKYIVLYFYPKDCTSGCTLQGQGFRDHYAEFKKLNTVILGISRDTVTLHEKFRSEQNFPFDLLSDTDQKICRLFEVIKEKNMYGKKVQGIERSTFLINPEGILVHEWRKVKVDGHVKAILDKIRGI